MQGTLHPAPGARTHGTSAPPGASRARGFSLVELLAALLLTVLTIMGLAHTLSLGNGFIDRYGTARAALARVNGQLEHVRAQVRDGLSVSDADSLSYPVLVPGVTATMHTHVEGVDDPANGPNPAGDYDYYKVRASIGWRQVGVDDSLGVSTLVYRP